MLRNLYDLIIIVAVVLLASLGSFPFLSSSLLGGGSGPGLPPGGAPPPPPQEANLSLNPSGGAVPAGGSLTVDVVVNTQAKNAAGGEVESIGGVDVYLEFDKSKLAVRQVTGGGLLSAFFSQETPQGLYLRDNVANAGDSPFSGEGVLARVEFGAAGAGAGAVGVNFGNGTILSVGGSDVVPTTKGATYTIP